MSVPSTAADKEDYLRAHAEEIYEELTEGLTKFVRLDELAYEAAERYPGLVPTRAEMEEERARKLADKQGLELAQGLFLAHVLSRPRAGLHLVHSMLRPTPEALERLDDFRSSGVADLGPAYVERRGRAGYLELRNP